MLIGFKNAFMRARHYCLVGGFFNNLQWMHTLLSKKKDYNALDSIKKKLRLELYYGLKDAVLRRDTDPITVGKRIVLPSSFTRSPRYMVQNYQDAIAICRWAGYPDLFLTFTCNPKWLEINHSLEFIEGLKYEDWLEIVARVFKIKLDDYYMI